MFNGVILVPLIFLYIAKENKPIGGRDLKRRKHYLRINILESVEDGKYSPGSQQLSSVAQIQ